ncbi:MAG: hypothetical protein K2O39_07320, partial [Clostridiales bacterium]|nr:hypothetical protein [Clostridiales bacterium]
TGIKVQFEATTPQKAGVKAELYEGNTKIADSKSVAIDTENPTIGTATFGAIPFDFLKEYTIKISTLAKGGLVAKTGLIDSRFHQYVRNQRNAGIGIRCDLQQR